MTVPRIKSSRNKSQKNKGKGFQDYVSRNLERLQGLKRLIYVELEVQRKKVGNKFIFTKKQHCDFIVISSKGDFWFDAKECGSEKFSISGKRLKRQADSFAQAQGFGKKAGFLVWFYAQDPARANIRFIEDFTKPTTIESGIKFDWELFV